MYTGGKQSCNPLLKATKNTTLYQPEKWQPANTLAEGKQNLKFE
jgi:hypothetical protein